MKSPWKFLVDLASRRRAAEGPDSTPEIETAKPDALSSAADAPNLTPTLPTDNVADPLEPSSDEVDSALDAKRTDIVAAADGDKVVSHDQVSLTERAKPRERQPAKRQKRTRKANIRNVAVASAVEYEDGSSGGQLSPMTFFDEVAALDEEIKQLRHQLAEKLTWQNAQLKKMLERF